MIRSSTLRLVATRAGAVLAVAALAACSTETTPTGLNGTPRAPSQVVTIGNGPFSGATVELCKWSTSSGPVDFTVSTTGAAPVNGDATPTLTTTTPLVGFPPYNFVACTNVVNSANVGSTDVTIVEDVPDGMTLDVITGDGNAQSFTPSLGTATVNLTVNNTNYVRVIFKNSGTPTDEDGCTYTQGYWKTHSTSGPAKKSDPTWLILSNDQHTVFSSVFGSKTWLQLFNTPPKGDAKIILAHQYMAAYLSVNNVDPAKAASIPASVTAAYNGAAAYFAGGAAPTAATMKTWAGILDSFNNGLEGVVHCGEEIISR